jgi:hypothetical protein
MTMDTRTLILCTATLLLLATSLIYGLKFLGRRNYLLGVEWLVVTLSTSNLLVYLLSGAQTAYKISYFCDAFSRGFGIPIIATAGLMAVTHRYKPSTFTDLVFFVGAIAGTAMLMSAGFFAGPLPYFYVLMWTAYSVYLAYFAYRLMRTGKGGHAFGVVVALVLGETVAWTYDLFPFPHDDGRVLFYTFALTTWSYTLVQLYYSYGALERAESAA